MELWGGRFSKAPNELALEFGASIDVDRRLARHDVLGSMAHCRMLARQGIISTDEARAILGGLKDVLGSMAHCRMLARRGSSRPTRRAGSWPG